MSGHDAPPWYQTAFADAYEIVYAHRDDGAAEAEIAFVLRAVNAQSGDAILDLACGNGRHERALRARGFVVTGVDLSPPLLRRHQAHGGQRLIRADMRHLPLADAAFNIVLSLFTSFGYFEDPREDLEVAREIRRVLTTGGRLFLDFLDAAEVRSKLLPQSERRIDGHTILEDRRVEEGRVRKRVRITRDDGMMAPLTYEESVRLYTRDELASLLDNAGLRVTASYGAFDGRAAGSGNRLLVVAEKQA